MNKKHIFSILIVIGLVAVIYMSTTNKRIHPPWEEWETKHAEVVNRNKNPDEFCMDCHEKKFGHTKENFCNPCHVQSNVPPVE